MTFKSLFGLGENSSPFALHFLGRFQKIDGVVAYALEIAYDFKQSRRLLTCRVGKVLGRQTL